MSICLQLFGRGLEISIRDILCTQIEPTADSQSSITRICDLAESHETQKALQEIRKLHKLSDKTNYALCFVAGLCCERLHKLNDAIYWYSMSADHYSFAKESRERLCVLAILNKDYDEAIVQCKEIIRAIPVDGQMRTILGTLHWLNNEIEESISAFQSVIAMQPDNWTELDENLLTLIASGQTRAAIKSVQQNIHNGEIFADQYLRLGNLYSLVGDDTPATKAYHQAIAIQPDYIEALIRLGTHHLLSNRMPEASEAYINAAISTENTMIACCGLGLAHATVSKKEDAINCFLHASDLEMNSAVLHARSIYLKSMSDEVKYSDMISDSISVWLNTQIHTIGKQIDEHTEPINLRQCYAIILRASGMNAASMDQLGKIIRYHRTNTPSLARLGLLLEKCGQHRFAARVFRRLFELSDSDLLYHYRLAHMYSSGENMADTKQIALKLGKYIPKWSIMWSLASMGLISREVLISRELTQLYKAIQT